MKANHALEQELRTAKQLALEAGAAILAIEQKGFHVQLKDKDDSPVTEADLAANQIIVQGLQKIFPQDAILSEESADNPSRLKHKRLWCIDPLDGTKEFVAQNGEYAIHIGLIIDNKPALGIVYAPHRQWLAWGIPGEGAFLESDHLVTELKASSEQQQFTLIASRSHSNELYRALKKKVAASKEIIHGSLGCKAILVAQKQADAFFYQNPYTKEWDTCAPEAIVVAAGGRVSNFKGEPLLYNKPDPANTEGVLFSNGACHELILNRLQD